jgi:ligand-binding sensor domain-containing protein
MNDKKKLKTYGFRFFFPLLLLFSFFSISAAQDKLYFQTISKDQGLSHATILTIIQDNKGFLWFGTPNGLNRYDGYSFKVFRHHPSDSNSLPDNIVLSLKQDRKGLLWIGTRSGLCNMDPVTGRISRMNPPDRDNHFNARDIIQYKDQNVWIGTEYGLYSIDKDMKMKKYPDKQLETSISSIQYDRDGHLWVAVDHQLFKITQNEGKISPTAEKITLPTIDSHISKLYLDPYGVLWIASLNEGLGILDTKRKVIVPVINPHAQKEISTILRTSATTILTGSEEGGFYQVAFGRKETAANEKSVSVRSVFAYTADVSNPRAVCSENVTVLYRDRTDNIWIGSIYSGLSKASLTQKKFKQIINVFKNKSGKTDNYVWGINQLTLNNKKHLLAGTSYNGLYFLNPGHETIYKHFYKDNDTGPSLRENFTGPVYIDSKKNVWIGSFRGGLQHYNPFTEQMTHYIPDNDSPGNANYKNSLADWSIRDINTTDAGELWVGTASGVSKAKLDKDHKVVFFKSYRNEKLDPNSIVHNVVWCVFQDSKGKIWLGTEAGISIYNEKEDNFDNIVPEPNGILSNTIKVIHERPAKAGQELWIGGNKGLCRLRMRDGFFISRIIRKRMAFAIWRFTAYWKTKIKTLE